MSQAGCSGSEEVVDGIADSGTGPKAVLDPGKVSSHAIGSHIFPCRLLFLQVLCFACEPQALVIESMELLWGCSGAGSCEWGHFAFEQVPARSFGCYCDRGPGVNFCIVSGPTSCFFPHGIPSSGALGGVCTEWRSR